MRRYVMLPFVAAGLALLASCAHRDSAEAVLRQSEQAMGSAQLKTVRYAGSGTGGTFGQAWQPGQPWPKINITSYAVWADYENGAWREDSARTRAEPNGGGALPLMGLGEQRVSAWMRGQHAWNMVGPAPAAAPVALDARIHDLWTSPHGVVKAALRNKASLASEGNVSVLSFTEPGRFRATVRIGSDGLVQRVDSVMPHHVSGDTAVSTQFSEWRDHGGLKFPGRITQSQGGAPVLDIRVTEVQANAPFASEVPALVSGFAERAASEKVADGVWFIGGGSHNSVLVEMPDHLILVESPLYDGRALAVLNEARRLVPGKPVRYVVNSHHHFDHSGGLRGAASEGATLVVNEAARPWFERTMAVANTVKPDALARSGRKVAVTGVAGSRNIGDANRQVIVHSIESSVHAQGFNMVWLPRERLLIEADAYTPAAPNTPPPAQPNANHVNLVANIERLKLNPERILPLHGRVVPYGELLAAVGRRP